MVEFITYDDNPIYLEGDSPRQAGCLIFKFPSEKLEKDWFADTAYPQSAELICLNNCSIPGSFLMRSI